MFFFFNDTATTEIYTLSHTTLFRSRFKGSRCVVPWRARDVRPVLLRRRASRPQLKHDPLGGGWRSEEHTSELQSQSNLVCRLLPAKKKNHISRLRSLTTVTMI